MRTEYTFFLSVVYDLLNAVIFTTKHCKRTYSLLKSHRSTTQNATRFIPASNSSGISCIETHLSMADYLFSDRHFVESRAVTQRTKKDHQQRVRNISSKCICVHICIRMYVMLQKLHTAL